MKKEGSKKRLPKEQKKGIFQEKKMSICQSQKILNFFKL